MAETTPPPDPDDTTMAALRAAAQRREDDLIAECVRRVVDAAPPLTAEQRSRLAVLFAVDGRDPERAA